MSEEKELEGKSEQVVHEVHFTDGLKWSTTRWELWSFYLFYVGNNGLSGFNFGPSQFQNLLFLAGYDPAFPPFSSPCGSGTECVLPFLGLTRSINSIVLVTNGISFALQAVLFLIIGAWADYGTWRPNITIAFTVVAVGISFAWLGVEDPSKWKAGVALYVIGLIAYQGALTFWTAAFPGLARDLPSVQQSASEVESGEKTPEEHANFESLNRNRISNVSFAVCSVGEILILAIMVGILKGIKAGESTESNTKAFSVLIAFSGGVWLLCALPWFFLEKRRPGMDLPPGTSFLTIGFKQTYIAFRECLKLKQTFLYLIFYFLILFWIVQKHYKISTKAMLSFNVVWIIVCSMFQRVLYPHIILTLLTAFEVLTIWGLAGVHTTRFGFKHVWEIWLYQAFYGLMVCPWYAYSQTMISEVSPLSQMFLFFALFSIVGKTSAFVGPFVSSAIINDAGGNNNMPFAFLFAVGMLSTILLYLVDVKKSREECEAFVKAEGTRELFKESHFDNQKIRKRGMETPLA